MLTTDDVERYRRAAAIFSGLSARVDRQELSSIVTWLWFDCGLRLSILRQLDAHPYLEHYDYLYALASRADDEGSSAAAFLSRLEPLMGKPEKLDDLDAQREAGSGVRIMSIHRSKGLEFPVVILPWIENTGRRDGAGEAFYLSEEAGLTLNLCPFDDPEARRSNVFYEEAKELDQAKAAAETKRLFYVACTRAETHLVFAAVEPHAEDRKGSSFLSLLAGGGGKPGEDGSFADLPKEVQVSVLPDLPEEEYRRLAGSGRTRPDPASFAAAYAAALPLDRSFGPRVLPATLLGTAGTTAAAGETLPASKTDGMELPEGLFGTACHALIEAGIKGLPLELPDRITGQVPLADRGTFGAEARRLAASFLDSAFWKGLSRMPRIESEKGIILSLGGGFSLTCRLDLALESEDELVIVDFKSNRERQAGLYDIQLAAYKAACGCLAPGKRVRAFLFWLRAARVEEVGLELPREGLLALAREAASRPLFTTEGLSGQDGAT